ncbi:uncharacterized protein LOC120187109 [Hibiscus syriacus]|uniref:uncharacterized protein LOC120187109 n=1 Tax=Hibiscus syriacus TaxID=106335 RepID=UPI00192224D5|nr:uncharacterized protein LOC120187109 [Hibiscus syriacus]
MALINIPTGHIQDRKTLSIERKSLMLKDYLRDDLSSCSSSGFKSFPRRQCCTTVRFLLETDSKRSNHNYSTSTRRFLKRSRSRPAVSTSTTISTLQRASEAVLNAVKLLPFPSTKSSSSSVQSSSWRKGKGDLPRSFARKLFKRRLWRKADKEYNHGRGEIKRWKLFREFLEEKNQPSVHINMTSYTTTDTSSSTVVATSRSSNRWADSEFTAKVLRSPSSNSESLGGGDAVSSKINLREKNIVSKMVGVTGGEDSIKELEQNRANDETKQQLSPVSVLDCPFDGEEEDDGSVFEDQLARVEGTKQRLMQKIIRFERLAQLEPLELEKRISSAELEDEPNLQISVELSKVKIPDLFVRERLLVEEYGVNILKKEWKQVHVKEMGEWIKFNVEKEEVGSALQLELFASLLDDLLIDLISH